MQFEIGQRFLWTYPNNENIREIIKIDETKSEYTVRVIQVLGKEPMHLKMGEETSYIVPLTDKLWKLLKNQNKPL